MRGLLFHPNQQTPPQREAERGWGEPGPARSNLTALLAEGCRLWSLPLSSAQRWHQHGPVSGGLSKSWGCAGAGCAREARQLNPSFLSVYNRRQGTNTYTFSAI